MNKDLFDMFLNVINSDKLKSRDELGGHSAGCALRAQLEKGNVFTAT